MDIDKGGKVKMKELTLREAIKALKAGNGHLRREN